MMDLITEYIATWTGAEIPKANGGRGRGRGANGQSPHGIKKLRELILELAVRGKLVPQDPNDEPASVLLEKIAKEKARLVKEGKIKKQHPLPKIRENENPFDLPKSWNWTRLIDLCVLENGDRSKNYPNKSALVDEGIPFINAGHLLNGRVNLVEMSFIPMDRFEILRSGKVQEGDILYCLRGSLGKTAIVQGFDLGAIASSLVIVRLSRSIYNMYALNYFNSPLAMSIMRKYDNGTAQPNLSASDLGKFLIPIPPLAEQHRIVAKVDELMALCDKLEQQQTDSNDTHQTLVETLLAALTTIADPAEFAASWQRIAAHFDTLFTTEESIDQLKQTILQLAVMGKLVPQDPNDEPASTLLEKITKEKAKLIKEGTIKKQKSLAKISEDEKPCDLPEGWEWARFGQLINLVSGQHLKPQEYSETMEEGMVPYLTGPAEFGNQFPSATRYTNEKRALAFEGDILITCKGSGVGKLNVADTEIAISRQLMSIQPILVKTQFVKLLAESMNEAFREKIVGIAIPGISREDVTEAIIVLPPLAEQHRIVAKVDELMALCDTLKERLHNAQITQVQLADAIVEQAVA